MSQRRDLIWMMLSDTPLSQSLRAHIESEERGRFVGETALPETGEIGVVIADDAHLGALKAARLRAGEAMQSIFITEKAETRVQADFVLSAETDFASLRSVLNAACDYRDQVLGLQADVARRKSAIGTIMSGQFVFRTLEEARRRLSGPLGSDVVLELGRAPNYRWRVRVRRERLRR